MQAQESTVDVGLVPLPITLKGPLVPGEKMSETEEIHSGISLELRASKSGDIRE